MQIIVSNTHSPSFNLAAEEYFLTECQNDILFFYVNTKSVIIGRNQNAFSEINILFCKQQKIQLVRRLSGGGAVYHDEGNINFCFITGRNEKPLDVEWLSSIQSALNRMTISTTQGKRKELYIGEKKITGTALHIAAHRQLFHGTLLYNANIQNLTTALKRTANITDRAVQSVRNEVTNILSHHPSLPSTTQFLKQFISYVSECYDAKPNIISKTEKEAIAQLQENRYNTWEWNWGQSPKSTLVQSIMWNGNSIDMLMAIEKGIITHVNEECPSTLRQFLVGQRANEFLENSIADKNRTCGTKQ